MEKICAHPKSVFIRVQWCGGGAIIMLYYAFSSMQPFPLWAFVKCVSSYAILKILPPRQTL